MTATRPSGAPETEAPGGRGAVAAGLGMLDGFLPLWIGVAMAAGLLPGRLVPDLNGALSR